MQLTRWTALMERLGWAAHTTTYEQLVAAYGESGRHYHTGAHIDACLAHLDAFGEHLERPHEVELALWFHDAIYAVRASDNEARSARWAAEFMVVAGAPKEVVERVHGHIMDTVHPSDPATADGHWMVDIDLAILGCEPSVYDAFEVAIRKEYAWVPGPIFRARRASLLASFLARDSIYFMAPARVAFEAQARENLAAAIARLRG